MQIKNDIIPFKKTAPRIIYYSSAKKIINIKLYPIYFHSRFILILPKKKKETRYFIVIHACIIINS